MMKPTCSPVARFGKITRAGALVAIAGLLAVTACRADGQAPAESSAPSSTCPVADYFATWFERVSKTQAEQPHWVTPVVTVTPRLEEEVRYDQFWQRLPNHHTVDIYGGKGLELIPAERVELIVSVPAYETENLSPTKRGWADETFLLKYRILSANAENGNYILTAFLGLSVPTGSESYTSHRYLYTPTIAFGKGWGNFDFQSTLGVSVPDNGATRKGPGTPLLLNTAFQYRLLKFLWPEVECNFTDWSNGEHDGRDQLFVTPGLVVGRFPLFDRVGLTFAAGCQFAVTDNPLIRRNIILSGRVPF